ncbi:MAG: ABA4-like family protein [Hyphomonadaceae bacterium]
MTYDLAFSLLNISVMPAWVLLILLPRAGITERLVHSAIYPVALGLFYAICFGFTLFGGAGSDEVDFTTLEGVRAVFATDIGILIGWSHYLVFDLFVGAWIGRDALRRGVTHWLAAPSMLLSYLLGPIGALLYFTGRFALKRRFTLVED